MCDTPLFRELAEERASQRRLANALLDAIVRDHDEFHDGPLRYCTSGVCQLATEHHHAA